MDKMNSLKQCLVEIDKIENEQWLSKLEERKKNELEFHDRDRDREKVGSLDKDTYERFYGNKKYYSATTVSKAAIDLWIASQAPGKIFLDYACGNGFNAIKAAKAGAQLAIGLDLSRVSINNARVDAKKEGVEGNTFFVQADAENTMLPDDSVDVIICSGMLHHLDLSKAFPELQRILAPGGRILAVEALDYNPFIKLYRHLTPDMRTEWEKVHILSLKDLRYADRYFNVKAVRYWHITSILAPYAKPLLPLFNALDRVLTKIPMIQLMAWMFTFELQSRKR